MQVRRIAREGPVCETAGAHGKQQHRPGKQVRMVDDERRRALLTEDGDQPGGRNKIQPYDQYHRRSGRGKTPEEVHGHILKAVDGVVGNAKQLLFHVWTPWLWAPARCPVGNYATACLTAATRARLCLLPKSGLLSVLNKIQPTQHAC